MNAVAASTAAVVQKAVPLHGKEIKIPAHRAGAFGVLTAARALSTGVLREAAGMFFEQLFRSAIATAVGR